MRFSKMKILVTVNKFKFIEFSSSNKTMCRKKMSYLLRKRISLYQLFFIPAKLNTC